jgi:hypothetical protein
MDEEEALFNFNKDKAIGVLTASNGLIAFSTVAIITVFIPLTYTPANHTDEINNMLSYLVILSAPVIGGFLLFYAVKYREYKHKCNDILVKSLKKRIIREHPGQILTVREVAKEIQGITDIPYKDIIVDIVELGAE